MLKGTALRRMVMSLLETGRYPMTVFTMSCEHEIQSHACVYPLFYWRKPCVLPLLWFCQRSSISFHRVQGCSICTCPFHVLVPEVFLQVLVSLKKGKNLRNLIDAQKLSQDSNTLWGKLHKPKPLLPTVKWRLTKVQVEMVLLQRHWNILGWDQLTMDLIKEKCL